MASETVATAASLSLFELQTIVQQQEEIFGPLIALGSQGQGNLITLEIGTTPSNRAQLEISVGEPPPQKPGHKVVCTGSVFVNSNSVNVTAYRKI